MRGDFRAILLAKSLPYASERPGWPLVARPVSECKTQNSGLGHFFDTLRCVRPGAAFLRPEPPLPLLFRVHPGRRRPPPPPCRADRTGSHRKGRGQAGCVPHSPLQRSRHGAVFSFFDNGDPFPTALPLFRPFPPRSSKAMHCQRNAPFSAHNSYRNDRRIPSSGGQPAEEGSAGRFHPTCRR